MMEAFFTREEVIQFLAVDLHAQVENFAPICIRMFEGRFESRIEIRSDGQVYRQILIARWPVMLAS
jgi:hypothetical protein